MNKIAVAKELMAIARELQATDFPSQDALDKYLKDHPDADKSNHKVRTNLDKQRTRMVQEGLHGRPSGYINKDGKIVKYLVKF